MVVRHQLCYFSSNLSRFLPLVSIAIRVDLPLIATLDIIATKRNYLLISSNSFRSLVLLAVNNREPIEEDRAIRLLSICILPIRMRRVCNQLSQNSSSIVIATERVIDKRLIVGKLERVGSQWLCLIQRLKRLVVVSLPAFDLRDMDL